MFERIKDKGFQVQTLHHAEAILLHDLLPAVEELEAALVEVRIPVEELVRGGGGEGELTQRLRAKLKDSGWDKHSFEIKKTIDGRPTESTSHEIDHVRFLDQGALALEIEWNNKDPFFDRDLENFKRLHGEGAISIGVVVTRGESLQQQLRARIEDFARRRELNSLETLATFYTPTPRQRAIIEAAARTKGSFEAGWAHAFVSDKFGEATTHWRKIEQRVQRGVGNPCPLILVGIPNDVVVDEE